MKPTLTHTPAIYAPKKTLIRGYPSAQLGRAGSADFEDALFGTFGQVRLFENPDRPQTEFHAILTARAFRHLQISAPHLVSGKPPARGEESQIYFSQADLETVLKAIRYRRHRHAQAKIANSWSR